MAQIYSRAILNISADASPDVYQGIFTSANEVVIEDHNWEWRPKLVKLPVESLKRGIQSEVYASITKGSQEIDDNPTTSVLQRRAWSYQEAALSPRRLRYTILGLLWTCCTLHISGEVTEREPHNIQELNRFDQLILSVYHIPYKSLPLGIHTSSEEQSFQVLLWWYHQVSDYGKRLLTFAKDRFPAMSSLANQFSDRTGYTYKAGIWVEDFRRGLLWTSCDSEIRLDHSPSWSWAVIEGGPCVRNIYETDELYVYSDTTDPPAELVSVEVENIGESPYGQVKWGKIILRGLCRTLAELNKEHDFYLHNGSVWSWSDKYGIAGKGAPHSNAVRLSMDEIDIFDEQFWERTDVLLIQISYFESFPDTEGEDESFDRPRPLTASYALVLQPTNQPEGTYRRIGVARRRGLWPQDVSWEMKIVTIV